MLILNDIHIGVQRQTGTTPDSREALRTYLFSALRATLAETQEERLVILGDLFDTFEVSPRDWIETYMILSAWARTKVLHLVAGNHDWSPKGTRMSSFEMLCRVLTQEYPDAVRVAGIDQWTYLGRSDVRALAHCSNQDIFNLKLDEILATTKAGDRILLHANFDNNFAVAADHSLNVSREQAAKFQTKGATLYFAHEHQAKVAMGGSVVVFGNQWPTSIQDCLGNDVKYAHVMHGGLSKVETWNYINDGSGYAAIDWRELGLDAKYGAGFIRVAGEASSNEASDVLNAIAKFRQMSKAFVITNAVQIDGIVQSEELPETFEAAKRFDVLEFLRDNLSTEQMDVIEGKLLKEGA